MLLSIESAHDFRLGLKWMPVSLDLESKDRPGGHCGFGLGATPNAVANMESLVQRFGSAPRAFLVVPMVGAFFIDFTNALIITTYINLVAP